MKKDEDALLERYTFAVFGWGLIIGAGSAIGIMFLLKAL